MYIHEACRTYADAVVHVDIVVDVCAVADVAAYTDVGVDVNVDVNDVCTYTCVHVRIKKYLAAVMPSQGYFFVRASTCTASIWN